MIVAGSALGIAGAAEAGALLPGSVPLCVARVSALLGERFGAARFGGLAMIGGAVPVVLLPAVMLGTDGRWPGYVPLLGAAFLSAGHTIALRRRGIGPWEAAAFGSLRPGGACPGGFTPLGEVPDGLTLAALLASAVGVVVVSRAPSAWHNMARPGP